MPTMGESPDATAVLRDIKPNEVSAVDVPAIGEPHMVVKGMSNRLDAVKVKEKQGGPMSDKKLDENDVPRPVMKVVHKRLTSVVEGINGLSDVVKNLKVTDDGAEKAPQVVVDMTKSLAAEIRSFLPSNEVPVEKRGTSESVLSLADITKRQDDIEKANAVSYLVRDRYVDIVQSVSEYMTTYVDGIEHDDNGPMLIPVGLDSTVDKAASELESLVEEDNTEESPSEHESDSGEAEVEKAADMTVREAFDRIMKAFDASKEMIKAAATPIVTEPQESVPMTEETIDQTETATDDTMAADASEPESAESSEPAAEEPTATESTEEPVAKSSDVVLQAIQALEKRLDEKFEKKFGEVEKSLDDIRKVAKTSEEKVDKALLKRADSRGGAPDRTTKVTDTSKANDEGSFSNVLGIRSVE